jgi:hypothetical protein
MISLLCIYDVIDRNPGSYAVTDLLEDADGPTGIKFPIPTSQTTRRETISQQGGDLN